MAKTVYIKIGLTGGTSNDVDGIDGSGLLDGDVTHSYVGGIKYEYVLDDDLSGVEDSPFIINPDANAGTKSWVLQVHPVAAGGSGGTTATAGLASLIPLTSQGDLLGHDGTTPVRIATAATNNFFLITDDSTPSGFRYKNSAATDATSGLIEIATYAEVQAGTDTTRAVTSNTLAQKVASEATPGIIRLATYAEMNTGTAATLAVTPATFAGKVASEATAGVIRVATYAEVNTGTAATIAITPATLAGRVASISTPGVIEIATSTEVLAMTDAARSVTPASLASLFQYQEETIWASAFVPGTTASATFGSYEWGTNDVCRDYFAFDGAADEHIRFSWTPPETWDRSSVKFKTVWTGAIGSSNGDKAVWGLKGKYSRDGDALDAAWGSAVTVSDLLTDDGPADEQITGTSTAVTFGGTAGTGCNIDIDVFRDTGNDDMTEDAWLMAVKIQFKNTKAKVAWS